MVYTTVYVSTLTHDLSGDSVTDLLDVFRQNNAKNGISGLLVMRGRRVMQLLEGEESAVRNLFARILADPRHQNVVTVWSSATEERRFPDWTMGFDDLEATSELPSPDGAWTTPHFATVPEPARGVSGVVDEYIQRRNRVLRRALVSGQQLVTTLALILHAHRPENVLLGNGTVQHQCVECRVFPNRGADQYPCATAKNAIWALETV